MPRVRISRLPSTGRVIGGTGGGLTADQKAAIDSIDDLEPTKFLGTYASLGALNTAHPSPESGSSALIDAGVGEDAQLHFWDLDDSKWVPASAASMTGAQIQTAYEAQAGAWNATRASELSGALTDIANKADQADLDTEVSDRAAADIALQTSIDTINTILTSDDTDLDTIQEFVDRIKAIDPDLDGLQIADINALQTTLDALQADIDTRATDASVAAIDTRLTTAESDIAGKEPAFAKQTGFNLPIGSAAGTVTEGNDSRLSDARPPTAHTHTKAQISDFSDGDYATAAQGATADTALQDITGQSFGDLLDVDMATAAPTDGQAVVWNNAQSKFIPATVSSGGVTDHGALTGNADDDHPQYHNDTRGDARYYTQTQVDSAIASEASTRSSADTTLQNNIDAVQSDVDQNESDADAAIAGIDTRVSSAELKLSNIEDNATADQTGAEIQTLYESQTGAWNATRATELSGAISDIAAEESARTSADAALQASIDTINTILSSDDTDLDTIQEFVDRIKAIDPDLDGLQIADINTLQTTLDALQSDINSRATNATVNAIDGRLGTAETKLSGIDSGATDDQTGAEIKTALFAEDDTNNLTDVRRDKLDSLAVGDGIQDTAGTWSIKPDTVSANVIPIQATSDGAGVPTDTIAERYSSTKAAASGYSAGDAVVGSNGVSYVLNADKSYDHGTVADTTARDALTLIGNSAEYALVTATGTYHFHDGASWSDTTSASKSAVVGDHTVNPATSKGGKYSDWRLPLFAVTPLMFGALGNGTNDDTSAFNSMIQTGAGVYIIPPGYDFRVSGDGIVVKSNSYIIAHNGATISLLNDDSRIFTIQGTQTSPIENVEIKGLTLDGKGFGTFAGGVSNHGWNGRNMAVYGKHVSNIEISRNTIKNFRNMGLSFPSPVYGDQPNEDVTISHNVIHTIGSRNTGVNTPYSKVAYGGTQIVPGEGIPVAVGDSSLRATATESNATNLRFRVFGNTVYNTYQTQISGGAAEDLHIYSNHLSDTDSNFIQVSTGSWSCMTHNNVCQDCTTRNDPFDEGRGISVHNSASGSEKRFIITNNHVKRSGLYGIDLRGDGMVVSGNVVEETGKNNATVSAGTIADIVAFSVGSNSIISNNRCIESFGSGVLLSAGSSNVVKVKVSDNVITDPAERGIRLRTTGVGKVVGAEIVSNTVDTPGTDGIVLGASEDVTCVANRINGAGTDGIVVATSNSIACSDILIATNKITGSSSNDIRIASGQSDIYFKSDNVFATSDISSNINGLLIAANTTLTVGQMIRYEAIKQNSGTNTITLPAAIAGMRTVFWAAAGTLTIQPPSGNFVDGAASVDATPGIPVVVEACDYGDWSYSRRTAASGSSGYTSVPASAVAAGSEGQRAVDDDFAYFRTATGWVRTPVATW